MIFMLRQKKVRAYYRKIGRKKVRVRPHLRVARRNYR
jgi:hypothetical protein